MQFFLNGLMTASTYLLIALGLSLVFGVMRIVNFAHGELIMFGGFITWAVITLLGGPYILALLAAIVMIAILGLIIDQTILRHIRGNLFGSLMVTLGLVYILQVVAMVIFGTLPKYSPPMFTTVLNVMGAAIPLQRVVVIATAAVLIILLQLFLQKTKPGRAIRASIQNREAAALQGVNLNWACIMAMAIAGALAGAAGSLTAGLTFVTPYVGGAYIWIAFIIVIVGGLGSIKGTLVAGLFFGFFDVMITTLVGGSYVALADMLAMLAVLVIRPQGLFGRPGVV